MAVFGTGTVLSQDYTHSLMLAPTLILLILSATDICTKQYPSRRFSVLLRLTREYLAAMAQSVAARTRSAVVAMAPSPQAGGLRSPRSVRALFVRPRLATSTSRPLQVAELMGTQAAAAAGRFVVLATDEVDVEEVLMEIEDDAVWLARYCIGALWVKGSRSRGCLSWPG
jgi:hypothetical protein